MRIPVGRAREMAIWMRGLAVNRIRAGHPGPRILANSIPKSGTHLLTRCLTLLPGIIDSGVRAKHSNDAEFLRGRLTRVGGGCYVPKHLPFTSGAAQVLEDLEYAVVLIIRDPRDVAVSDFHYMTHMATYHHLHQHFRALPDDSVRLMTMIEGIGPTESGGKRPLVGIGDVFRAYLPWDGYGACILRFEKLVGPNGGGAEEAQREEIGQLTTFLELDLTETELDRIAERVFFRKSTTFRKGVIGDWRNHFTDEHRAVFKETAGQILIDLGYEEDLDW